MLAKKAIWIICLLSIWGLAVAPFPASAFEVRLGTGAPGSFSYFAGRVLCRTINNQAIDIQCQQVPAADDVYNLTNLQGGALDISLVDSRELFSALEKTDRFKFLDISYQNLRVLAPLYDVPITLIARTDAGIASVADLKGKRLNAGNPGSPQDLAVDTILEAKKWSRKDFSLIGALPPIKSQDKKALCYGTMQAMVYVGIHPDFSLRQLLKDCNAELVPMEDNDTEKLVNDRSAFWKTEIAASTYPAQAEKISTFGTRGLLVAAEEFDSDTVYRIVELMVQNRKALTAAHQAFALFSQESARQPISGIRRHPGADRYFTEH